MGKVLRKRETSPQARENALIVECDALRAEVIEARSSSTGKGQVEAGGAALEQARAERDAARQELFEMRTQLKVQEQLMRDQQRRQQQHKQQQRSATIESGGKSTATKAEVAAAAAATDRQQQRQSEGEEDEADEADEEDVEPAASGSAAEDS
jgi:hypothetical protein